MPGEIAFDRLKVDRFRRKLSEHLASRLGISSWSAARALQFSFRSSGSLRRSVTGPEGRYRAPSLRGTGPAGARFPAGTGYRMRGPGAQYSADFPAAV